MARGLDHIVHAVRDLDAGAELYRRLGFTVGARNRHPWGTHNHIVQLPGFFVEVLTMAEPDKLGEDGFSKLFGDYNRRFLEQGEGFSLLILESTDAAADARAFADAKIAASEVMRFERQGTRPDGTPMTVAFSLAFARDARACAQFRGLPAALSGEFLESGLAASSERCHRRRQRGHGRRQSERPSHLSVGLCRPARIAVHIGGDHGGDAARRSPGHHAIGVCGLFRCGRA